MQPQQLSVNQVRFAVKGLTEAVENARNREDALTNICTLLGQDEDLISLFGADFCNAVANYLTHVITQIHMGETLALEASLQQHEALLRQMESGIVVVPGMPTGRV